jgi:hypothetical protein
MRKSLSVLIILLLTLCFNSFSQDSTGHKGIAPEYSNFKGTLLVLENRDFKDNTLNRMTQRRFDKNYKGDYEMIEEDDLTTKSYSDKKKFRFVVQLRNHRAISRDFGGAYQGSDATKFVMVDRLTNIEYETRTYANWTHLMNQYIDLLEKLRYKD